MINITKNKGINYYKHHKDILGAFLLQKLCFKIIKSFKKRWQISLLCLSINAFIKFKIDRKVTNGYTYCSTYFNPTKHRILHMS